jgi:RNA polymerase sigma-70 factor (ECF subfamily)
VSETDETLVARYQKGDAGAFRELYFRHRIATFNFILHVVRERTAAEDLHQEIWITAIRAVLAWRPTGTFKSWLFQVARNRCLDHLRKIGRSPVDDDGAGMIEAAPSTVPWEGDPVLRAALLDCIENLNDTQRQVFVLRATQSLTFGEITHVMSSPPGLANRRMQLAVEHLKRCLESKGIGAEGGP